MGRNPERGPSANARARVEGSTPRAMAAALVAGLSIVVCLPTVSAAAGPSLIGPSIPSPQERAKLSVAIDADRMEYLQQEDRYVADGNAVLTYGAFRLTADHLSYANRTSRLDANGRVVLTQGAQQMTMDRLEYDLREQTGVMYQADLLLPESSYRLTAKRIERRPDGSFLAEEATFTTCDTVCEGGTPSWQFQARRLQARLDGYLVASGATLRVKGAPVAYLPWMAYPLAERQSGVLIPSVGFNSEEGFRYLQPVYWAIGRSQDATVALDLRTNLGIGVDSEYRYRLTETGKGLLNVDYFHDWDDGANFLAYHAEHEQRWQADRLQLHWDVNLVNRRDFFTQLSDSTLERSQVGLETIGSLTYRLDQQFFYLFLQYTQNLVTSNQQSLQRLPEIGYRLVDARLGPLPLYAGLQATAVHFSEGSTLRFDDEGAVQEFRADALPTLTARLEPVDGVIITPAAGFRETYYRSGPLIPAGSVNREVVNLSFRAEARLIRRYTGVTHVVEPVLLYEYVHQLDEATVPQFDEVDMVPEKRHVTMMLTNRLRRIAAPAPAAGSETGSVDRGGTGSAGGSGAGDLLWVKVTESYALNRSAPEPLTDLRIQAAGHPWSVLAVTAESFVNLYGRGITMINSGLHAKPADWLVLTVGEHYTRRGVVPQRGDLYSAETLILPDPIGGAERIAAVDWGAQVLLPWRLALATKTLYDVEHDELTEMSYGLRWRGACNECWSVTVAYQQFPEKHQVLFLITLRGLSGSDPTWIKELFIQ
ncbi:MAG: LPS-assembly protein LptD [Nitrospirae bacterium]|nr:LPS-assembly protein LptD [Nitrospirota bacterium]